MKSDSMAKAAVGGNIDRNAVNGEACPIARWGYLAGDIQNWIGGNGAIGQY